MLWSRQRVIQIYGANTNVGKTVISTILMNSILSARKRYPHKFSNEPSLGVTNVDCSTLAPSNSEKRSWSSFKVNYVKVISTGNDATNDCQHVLRYTKGVAAKCLIQFDMPVSPHLAAIQSGKRIPSDCDITRALEAELSKIARCLSQQNSQGFTLVETAGGPLTPSPMGSLQADAFRKLRLPVLLIADSRLGGISSTISAYESLTIRGYDVLGIIMFREKRWKNSEYLSQYFSHSKTSMSNGCHTNAVLQPVPVFSILPPPELLQFQQQNPYQQSDALYAQNEDFMAMTKYYTEQCKSAEVDKLVAHLDEKHAKRIDYLENLSRRANECIWYPFHQHVKQREKDSWEKLITIDSAYNDYYNVYSKALNNEDNSGEICKDKELLYRMFDGSASWWTQGLSHGNAQLALTSAYAAGRYGHVIFAGTVHELAVELVEKLLKITNSATSYFGESSGLNSRGVGYGKRLTRGFFSDDGSTGIEVAVKMGLRAFERRLEEISGQNMKMALGEVSKEGMRLGRNRFQNEHYASEDKYETIILGLKGSYHGDTIGAMDCSEPSSFNERVAWYKGRGVWLNFPQVKLKSGTWKVSEQEDGMDEGKILEEFGSLDEVFNFSQRRTSARIYEERIKSTLYEIVGKLRAKKQRLGSFVMEPVILGAGGMIMVDPLFQACLVRVIRQSGKLFGTNLHDSGKGGNDIVAEERDDMYTRMNDWTGLPIIYDEVFTGIYRLGKASSSHFLQDDMGRTIQPDISVHAKLLTGGIVPLAITLASESIFKAFLGECKRDALLHGHSYTGHAIGCAVGLKALNTYKELDECKDGEWEKFRIDWRKGKEKIANSWKGKYFSEMENDKLDNKPTLWSVWQHETVMQLSFIPGVEGVVALGSVLAVSLKVNTDNSNKGYMSTITREIQDQLICMASKEERIGVHVRVLGNVFYVMTSLITRNFEIEYLEKRILEVITKWSEVQYSL